MSYLDSLRRVTMADGRRMVGAAFRGVPFYVVDSRRGGGGRRVAIHEFPFRDLPWVDDLGRGAKSFRLEGYVLGDDYVDQRNRLQAALEDEEGPGELVHPYWGVIHAICTGLEIGEGSNDGRMATFSIEFIETPAQFVFSTSQSDPETSVSLAADASLLATAADLADRYDATTLPSFALESLEGALVAASEKLDAALSPITGTTAEMARMTQNIDVLSRRASSLVTAPGDALSAFRGTFGALVDTAGDVPHEVMGALLDAYAFDGGTRPPATTATRQREQANFDALIGALRSVLVIEAARLAPRIDFDTYEDAVAARDRLAALLDEQAELAGDAAYLALAELRATLVQAVPGDQDLARVVVVSVPSALPALVIAHRAHGTVEHEAELIARNRIRHPGFVAGDVEILTDE
jgi:prophage DNA circulation protein